MKTIDYKTFTHHLFASDIEVFNCGSLIPKNLNFFNFQTVHYP